MRMICFAVRSMSLNMRLLCSENIPQSPSESMYESHTNGEKYEP